MLAGCVMVMGIMSFVFVAGILGTILRAFIISQVWGWYISPLFGLGPLPMIFAFGLSCFMAFFNLDNTGAVADKFAEKSGDLEAGETIGLKCAGLIGMLALWLFAWIGTFFLPEDLESANITLAKDKPAIVETIKVTE